MSSDDKWFSWCHLSESKLWKILIYTYIFLVDRLDTGSKFERARLWINADMIMAFNWFSSFRFLSLYHFLLVAYSVYMTSCSIKCYSLHTGHTELHCLMKCIQIYVLFSCSWSFDFFEMEGWLLISFAKHWSTYWSSHLPPTIRWGYHFPF